MDGKIWGYGAGEARPIPPISFLFRRFPENPYYWILDFDFIGNIVFNNHWGNLHLDGYWQERMTRWGEFS